MTPHVNLDFDDAPPFPAFESHDPNLWERLVECFKALVQFLDKVFFGKDEGHVSDEEAIYYKKQISDHIADGLQRVGSILQEALKIRPGERTSIAKMKLAIAKKLRDWLVRLAVWLIGKVEQILEWIKQAFLWCKEKISELCHNFYIFVSSCFLPNPQFVEVQQTAA